VHQASEYALQEMAAQTLVIVADQTGTAVSIYHSVGFRDAETQVQLQRGQTGQGAGCGEPPSPLNGRRGCR
jgi:hypothetical protein